MFGRLLRSAAKLLLAAVLFLLTLEAVLALWPDVLPTRLANHAFSKYGDFPGGMYFFDPQSGINFLRPNFETEAYFNGYSWTHSADQRGFRNPAPPGTGAVLLLGDSLIYGHGVEEESTVAHHLRTENGINAYNMARQGDCLYQSYVLARLNLDRLQPSAVVLFVFLNDFHDLTLYRSEEEMRQRPEASWDYAAMRTRLDEIASRRRLDPKLFLGLASVRLLRGVWGELTPLGLVATAEAAPSGDDDLPYLKALLDPATFARTAGYFESTLADLNDQLGERGIEFLVVDLALGADLGGKATRAQQRLSGFVAGACQRLDLSCASAAGIFDDCDACFLHGDGHLSDQGHRRLADWVAEVLSETADATAAR